MPGSQCEKRDELSRDDLRYLDTRPYLDRTVVPVLMQALTVIAKERPPNPVEALANYLLQHAHSGDS
ncbi:hypothetical protein TcWFU_010285 [Taenia crassiceps]|uniref:Uncharacterized protein n=1 Tax=Taenia crassiceps TaxID=6207 RepID=A0ABR4QJD5_9CEST